MKIKISKDALNKHLTFLQTGVPGKAIIPVDGWFNFSITKEHCNIKIANSAVEMSTYMKVEAEDDCEFCVPAFIMARTVANFPDGDIHLTPKVNENLGVVSIEMKPEGQRKKYKVACYPVGEFGHWPIPEDDTPDVHFKMNMAELHERLSISGSNVDTRDIRPQFSNIIFYSYEGKLMVISGNSFVIACLDTDIDFSESKIVPAKFSAYTSTLSQNGECELSITKNLLKLKFGSSIIITRIVDGTIPAYNKLFEQEPDDSIIVDRIEFVSAIKRLSIFSSYENKVVLECKDNSLLIYTKDDNNEAEEYIDVVNDTNMDFRKVVSYPFLQASIENTKSEKISLADNGGTSNLFVKPVEGKTKQVWMVAPHAG